MKFRWFGIALVAATALSPIMTTAAEAQDRGGGFGSRVMREARGGGGENRPQRAERQQAPQRQQAQERQADQPRPQRAERAEGGRRDGGWRDGGWQGRQAQGGRADAGQVGGQADGQRQQRWQGRQGGDADGNGDWRGRRGQQAQESGDAGRVQDGARWDGRRRGGFGDGVVRDARAGRAPVQPGTTFDRDNDGRVDPQWDRNRNGRVDEVWDDNRNGRLDRRWDRNRDGRLDGRWDRNDDERVDRRWDRNGNGRVDGRYQNSRGGWDRAWRNDRRYDWYGHRSRYNDVYRLGRYYSPYRDWRYRRLDIGFSLWPLFYSNQYWINDPWSYRLPEAYGPYRWVRYYDDALLVDVRTGQVVDVIHDVFW